MNWKTISTIWNILSITFWIIALFFVSEIIEFIFSFINNPMVLKFQDSFIFLSILFFVLMILFNIASTFFSVKAENQKAMLWLIGLTYAQFLFTIVYFALIGLLFSASYFL